MYRRQETRMGTRRGKRRIGGEEAQHVGYGSGKGNTEGRAGMGRGGGSGIRSTSTMYVLKSHKETCYFVI